jgi:spore germination protein YaaH
MFAAYFDESGAPVLTERVQRWISREAEAFRGTFRRQPDGPAIPIWLSVVNDILTPDGTVFKDPDIVSRLVGTEEARKAHIEKLLSLVSSGPFDGLEIDYERVRRDDWKPFLLFCAALHDALAAEGKALRVVLEPKKEYYGEAFPDGPEYVIMAYNLFGPHSGPGPRADAAFIERLSEMTASMDPRPRLALATGGFIWDGGRSKGGADAVRYLTESEARLVMQREGAKPERDEGSGYLNFSFPEGSRNQSVVWFADGETLAFLAAAAKSAGFRDFALWSFQGNRKFSLDAWRTEVTK